jgi:hypothetical protein
LPGQDAGGALEPVDPVGGLVLHSVQRRDDGQPAAQRGRGPDDVGRRQVGVQQRHPAVPQHPGQPRHGPRIPRRQPQLVHRDAEPSQRADLGCVGRRRQGDDDEVHPDLRGRAGEVDQTDLRAVGMQRRDEVGNPHRVSDGVGLRRIG